MVEKEKKLPKVFDYFVEEDQFAGGNTFCAGCPAELTLRIVPKVWAKTSFLWVLLPVLLLLCMARTWVPGINCRITPAL